MTERLGDVARHALPRKRRVLGAVNVRTHQNLYPAIIFNALVCLRVGCAHATLRGFPFVPYNIFVLALKGLRARTFSSKSNPCCTGPEPPHKAFIHMLMCVMIMARRRVVFIKQTPMDFLQVILELETSAIFSQFR